MKTLRVVLAVGLLVGAAIGMAQAQSAGTPATGIEPYHGSAGPAASYPPDYYGIQSIDGWIHNIQAGGTVGYPPDYSNTPDASGWIHNIQAGGTVGYPPDYSNTPNTSGWIRMSQ